MFAYLINIDQHFTFCWNELLILSLFNLATSDFANNFFIHTFSDLPRVPTPASSNPRLTPRPPRPPPSATCPTWSTSSKSQIEIDAPTSPRCRHCSSPPSWPVRSRCTPCWRRCRPRPWTRGSWTDTGGRRSARCRWSPGRQSVTITSTFEKTKKEVNLKKI